MDISVVLWLVHGIAVAHVVLLVWGSEWLQTVVLDLNTRGKECSAS